MNLKAIVFDCDGVIFDSREANRAYYNAILKNIGLPPLTEEQLNFAHCHTVFEVIDYLVPDPSLREKAYFVRKNIDYQQFLGYMKLEPYVTEALGIFKEKFKTAMATSRTNTIHKLLKQYSLDKYFDVVVSALDVQSAKPHPEALYKIMDAFKIAPDQMLYIGDAHVDAEMAKNAHVPFVAYKNPKLRADFHVSSFLELAEIIGIKI